MASISHWPEICPAGANALHFRGATGRRGRESQGTRGCACVKSVAKLTTGGESAQSPGARRGQAELSGTGKVI